MDEYLRKVWMLLKGIKNTERRWKRWREDWASILTIYRKRPHWNVWKKAENHAYAWRIWLTGVVWGLACAKLIVIHLFATELRSHEMCWLLWSVTNSLNLQTSLLRDHLCPNGSAVTLWLCGISAGAPIDSRGYVVDGWLWSIPRWCSCALKSPVSYEHIWLNAGE